MNKVLIVYESVPEDTDLYLLVVTDDELKKIKICHNQFINTDFVATPDHSVAEIKEACSWLSEKLSEDWAIAKIENETPTALELEGHDLAAGLTVVVTGFLS
jgi:hypothetical protein